MRAPPPASASIVLDLAAGRLWIDDKPVGLRPKTWEVLCALTERSGQLVTKDELLDLVWADTAVSEGTLSKSIGELRLVFADSREAPRCIETISRRGFRWIGQARIVPRGAPAPDTMGAAAASPPATVETAQSASPASSMIAREDELDRLAASLARARSGKRQVVFVTGEAGAGKTTLIDRFLDGITEADGDAAVMVAHGQCIETSGPHEPYLPLLDAFESLARRRSGAAVAAILRRCAPTWAAQMSTIAPSEREAPSGAAPLAAGSMLREFVTAVDEIARDQTLVLVLEDAHWADLASTDACSALARRRDAAQLLVIVTKRNAEAMVLEHPIVALRSDLVSRRMAEEIGLVPFDRQALRTYLATRCPGLEQDEPIVECLLHQTAGNPLFVRLVVDEWVAREMVAPSDGNGWASTGDAQDLCHTVPDSLRALLERQIDQLAPAERIVLEAASVRVGEFHAASIAAATAMAAEDVGDICDRIAGRGQLLRADGRVVTPGGMVVEQYAFLHATIQNVVTGGVPSARWRRLHLAAAEQLERENAGRTGAACSLLAIHYEAAGDTKRALLHLRESARQAMHRDAPRDAIVTLERILDLVDANPLLPDPDGERVQTLSYLSHARQLAFGFVDSKVGELWSRTSELATSNEDARERIVADAGLIVVACVSGRYAEAEEMIRTALPLVDLVEEAGAKKTFFFAAGTTRYRIAAMDDARTLFDTALAMEHTTEPVPGADLTALLMSQYAPAVSLSGRPDYVRELTRISLERARAHSQYSECVTGTLVAWALAVLHDFAAAAPIAARALEIAEELGIRTWTTRPLYLLGMHAIADGRFDEGAAQVRSGLAGRKADGQWVDHSAMCCLFAETLLDAGRDGAEDLLDEAADFSASSGELYAESEIFRLRAKARQLAGATFTELEPLLRRALDLARLRGIRWHALLAATDLASLLLEQGRNEDAAAMLEPACSAIVGGADLAAVRRGNVVLEKARGPGGLQQRKKTPRRSQQIPKQQPTLRSPFS